MLENLKKVFDKKNKQPIPDDGKTLYQTVNDDEASKHFGAFLDSKGGAEDELAQRLHTETLTGADIARLAELRKEHNERMNRVANLEKACSQDNIHHFAANSEQFRGIVEILGPAKATKMIKGELYNLLEKSPDEFDELYSSWDKIEQYRNNELKELDESILEQCAGLGIKQKDFEAMLLLEDQKDKMAKLVPKIKDSYGGFMKAWSWISGAAKRDAKKLIGRESDITAAFDEIDGYRGAVGETLGQLTTNNPDVLAAFNREILDKAAPAKDERTSFMEVQKQLPPDKAEVMTDWATYKTANSIVDLSTLGALDQQKHIDDFKKQQLDKQEKKAPKKEKSFWQRMFGGIFGSFFDKDVVKDLK